MNGELQLADISEWPPSPVASLAAVLVLLATLVVLALFVYFVHKTIGWAFPGSRFGNWILRAFRSIDRFSAWPGELLAGSPHTAIRVLIFSSFFGGATASGVLLNWPINIGALSIGLLGVFAVFRHWSWSEANLALGIEVAQRDRPVEMIAACACVFVFAPIAFSQIYRHDATTYSVTNSGPLIFVLYMVQEMANIGNVIPFWDFRGKDFLSNWSGVTAESFDAKLALLVFKGTWFYLIVKLVVGLIEGAQRFAEGLDLQAIAEELHGNNQLGLSACFSGQI